MEISVMSRETIKPSSPTPLHLKFLKLSLIDQFLPTTFYARIILFYSAQGDVHRFHNTNMSRRFKKSLSEVLTDFYPVAGKFDNFNHLIECNDDGLEYTEARVKAPLTLSQLLACPKPEELDLLQPHDAYNYATGFRGLSAVQVTVFEECGGMAIGVSLSHLAADAPSLAVFINTWAAIVRGDDKHRDDKRSVPAIFDSASLFPPRDMPAQNYDVSIEGTTKCVVKRFVFPQSNIDGLKGKFTYERPTRVEVVSALLLKCMISVIKSRCSESILPGMPINLRGRMDLPSPVHYFGNIVLSFLMEQVESGWEWESLDGLGMRLRKFIRKINRDYVEKLQADNESLLFEIMEQQTKLEGRVIGVTSWCRFPVYEADVGWGVPKWVASVNPTWKDCVVIMDAKNGDGIEAWATLDEDDMALFESNSELLEFAYSNPMVCEL